MKNVPSSVYRLQLTETFSLKDATAFLPYLHDLGIEGVFCSPYFTATSTHGYDITDPNTINEKLATPKQYETFCQRLKELKMFHIADVVPNHMGIKGSNKWWQDVLEKGPHSEYAKFFDIDWSGDKILVPILGEDKIIEEQYYRLVPWWTSATKTSYRRFFNINELIGLRIENPEVLREHHKLIFELLHDKKVDGLRVDHPDGLYDPEKYFQDLRKKHKGLILVEKILGFNEDLPGTWDVDGTVGYEFLNMLTGVFVKIDERLSTVYSLFIGKVLDFDEMLYLNKKSFLLKEMRGDLDNLCKLLDSPFGTEKLRGALIELLACFPVYRSYISPNGPILARDKIYFRKAFEHARVKKTMLSNTFDYLEDILTLKRDEREFVMRFQQLCAPIMAKGFEDITLYNYNRLLALNEVGSDPKRHGVTKKEFHAFCKRKQEKWPLGLLTTSTHDTKRSMDVRMQLATLSQIPDQWGKVLDEWTRLNQKYKTKDFPDRNAEYFLYQILLGVWPSDPSFKRMWASFQKSIREARVYTNWQDPNEEYEKACEHFLKAILRKNSLFLKSFATFQKKIQKYGECNSISAAALKLGGPGIVDIYEGCENPRYTLVDPDNRTPVNFKQKPNLKYRLHKEALNFRKKHKALFLEGKYVPLEVEGPASDLIIAYLRIHEGQTLLVAGIRFFPTLKGLRKTEIVLERDMGVGKAVFSRMKFEEERISANRLFSKAPFAWVFWG